MEDATHMDIIRRVEKVELDVAVLDSKSNRLHEDVTKIDKRFEKMETEMRANGEVARSVQTTVNALPKIMTILIMMGGLMLTAGLFVIERLL